MGHEIVEAGKLIAGAATLWNPLVLKILGPTADYLGEASKEFTKKRIENLTRVFQKAGKKLGNKIDKPGAVPLKVIKGIIDDGSFVDDELAAEYFGGVLASSRSTISRDDRGASLVSLIARLSSYQLRSHCVFYHTIQTMRCRCQVELLDVKPGFRRTLAPVVIPFAVYLEAMAFDSSERWQNIVPHTLSGLERENLIKILSLDTQSEPGLMTVEPTVAGVELLLWAYGRPELDVNDFFKPENILPLPSGIMIAVDLRISSSWPG